VSHAERFVVAIDGPAASGKSTTARLVAERLGFRQADSGALYRAATAARLRRGGAPETWTEDSVLEAAAAVSLVPGPTAFEVRLNGERADEEVRGAAVTAAVSRVAKMRGVRAWVKERMRDCARAGPLVADGRDMGTAVFPDAPLKVYLVADPRERARRRALERLGRDPTDAELAAEAAALDRRDALDAEQSRPAPDAIVLDTTALTQEQQVERIVTLARGKPGL
jgi:cytidylate kinase